VSVPTRGTDGADGTAQATFAATMVDEWRRGGVTDAVVCPGSRSTPLALALGGTDGLRTHVRLDERSAGFYAVGLARSSGRPVVVCTTSGTAAAELHPAVLEAHLSQVPLIVCTADRPPELHHVGAPQTVDQTNLYGPAVRWSAEPGVPESAVSHTWRPLAARALAEAGTGPHGPGPVHLNLAFRDPLAADPGPLPPGRPGHRPVAEVHGLVTVPDGVLASAAARWSGRRGLFVAGEGSPPASDLLALARVLGWPVLADPRSGCRVADPAVVAAADSLARSTAVRRVLVPDVVVALGAPWTSKALTELLAAAAADQAEIVAVDPWWRWRDPERLVTETHRAEPAGWVRSLLGHVGEGTMGGEWLAAWQAAEKSAQSAIEEVVDGDHGGRGQLSEPAVARRLLGLLPAGSELVASSSMPVRDLEWFSPPMDDPPLVRANRGANGIDGVCSTTLGAAAAGRGPVVGLVGDLAFLHDVSALVRPSGPAGPSASCTLVVVDNGGGGIFNFLPQATSVAGADFERLFATPQRVDVVSVAAGFGVPTLEVATAEELDEAIRTTVGRHDLAVIVARVLDRVANVALHDRVHDAVSRAAEGSLARSG